MELTPALCPDKLNFYLGMKGNSSVSNNLKDNNLAAFNEMFFYFFINSPFLRSLDLFFTLAPGLSSVDVQ